MYIVLIGAGAVGYHLARALLNASHEVSIVEQDAKKAMDAADDFGNVVLRGNGSDSSLLEAAGAARADVVIATTGNDEDNLAACQLARHRFNVDRTVALINNPENEVLFRLLGIDITVSSTQIIMSQIEEELPVRVQFNLLSVRGNREMVRVEVPPGADVVDKPLQGVVLPAGTSVTALISRDGRLKTLNGETTIEAHDEVIALTSADNAGALLETITGEA